MIEIGQGDLLKADVDALVNTVNTVGVMGKGIALQFKQAFPDNFRAYKRACDRGEVLPGSMFVFDRGGLAGAPRLIINFPTKRHWRSRSRIEDIRTGLEDLRRVLGELRVQSVAVPPLGCGNGGLRWSDVEPLIHEALGELPVRVVLFPPAGAPPSRELRSGTSRPALTTGRAALLGVMARYGEPGTTFTKLEIQKIAYFLQVAGQPLRLDFVRHHYGPYAEALNHVLQRLEGHYLRGYGDRSGPSGISLDRDRVGREVAAFLRDDPQTLSRLDRVVRLFEGLESPHGAELLATVHWLAVEDPGAVGDPAQAVSAVHAWSERKRRRFPAHHIEVAWRRLRMEGWLPAPVSAAR